MEYRLLLAAEKLACILPLRAALAAGWLVAAFFFHLLRFRRTAALQRIHIVFGDRFTPRQRRRIAWLSFRNLCFNAVEAARFHKLTPEQIRRMPIYEPIHRGHDLAATHGALIVATAHMGNWDLAGVVCKLDGLPIFSIARRQKNPLADELLNRMRGATGMEVIANDSRVLQNVVRRLKQGGILAILPDVRSKSASTPVPFLGGTAHFGAGTALFAQLSGAPVLPVILRRRGWTTHECTLFDPIFPDPSAEKKEDRIRIMRQLAALIDNEIRAHPEQYFWFNKRWVLDPPQGSGAVP